MTQFQHCYFCVFIFRLCENAWHAHVSVTQKDLEGESRLNCVSALASGARDLQHATYGMRAIVHDCLMLARLYACRVYGLRRLSAVCSSRAPRNKMSDAIRKIGCGIRHRCTTTYAGKEEAFVESLFQLLYSFIRRGPLCPQLTQLLLISANERFSGHA
jgi:hypothetical protein